MSVIAYYLRGHNTRGGGGDITSDADIVRG